MKNLVAKAKEDKRFVAEVMPEIAPQKETVINIVPPPRHGTEHSETAHFAKESYHAVKSISTIKDSEGNIIVDAYAKKIEVEALKSKVNEIGGSYTSKSEIEALKTQVDTISESYTSKTEVEQLKSQMNDNYVNKSEIADYVETLENAGQLAAKIIAENCLKTSEADSKYLSKDGLDFATNKDIDALF